MAQKTFIGGSTAGAQVWKGTITTTTTGHTYTLPVSDESGNSATFSYALVGGDTTVSLAATSWAAAWNASTDPHFTPMTASTNAGQVILTADTAGTPFLPGTPAGTGTWSGTGTTTPNTGPYDAGDPNNYAEKAVVAAGENFVHASGSILYNLNQTANITAGFTCAPGCTGTRGAPGQRFKMAPTSYNHYGTGQAYDDIGSAAITPRIVRTASVSQGQYGLDIIGSAMSGLRVESGSVGVAIKGGETATITTVQNFGGTVYLGAGATVTNYYQNGGSADVVCAGTLTAVTADGGTLTINGTQAITTLTNNGATIYPNSSGTISSLVNNAGTTDFLQNRTARTVSAATLAGGTIRIDSAVITLTAKIAPSGHVGVTAAAA